MATRVKYMLDTCVCIALIKGQASVVERIREVGIGRCCVSELTLAELYFGAAKSGRQSHYEDVETIKRLFEQRSITPCLRRYGDVRWELERTGMRIDTMDLLIGTSALQEKLTLVTGNVRHFERIPGLSVENWM